MVSIDEYERQEKVCKEVAMSQWERSLKRTDLDERSRVIGAIEAYKRQAFVFNVMMEQANENRSLGKWSNDQ